MPAVLVIQIAGRRRSLALDGRTTIGRSDACRLRLNANAVSRQHAVIDLLPDTTHWFIEDTGSLNGTWVNSHRAVAKQTLASRDRIRIGDARLVFVELAEIPVGTEPKREIADGKPAGVLFRCPACRKKLIAPPGSAKSLRRCGKCRARFIVPVASASSDNEPAKKSAPPKPPAKGEAPAPPPPIPQIDIATPEPLIEPVVEAQPEATAKAKISKRGKASPGGEPADLQAQPNANEPARVDGIVVTPAVEAVETIATPGGPQQPESAPFTDAFPAATPMSVARNETTPPLPAAAPLDDAPTSPDLTHPISEAFLDESTSPRKSHAQPHRDEPPPSPIESPAVNSPGNNAATSPTSTAGQPLSLDAEVTLDAKHSPPLPVEAVPDAQTFHIIAPAEHPPSRPSHSTWEQPVRAGAEPVPATPASTHPATPTNTTVPAVDALDETPAIQRGPSPASDPALAVVADPAAQASPPSRSGATPNLVEPVPPRAQRPKPVAHAAPSPAVIDRPVVVMSRPPVAASLPRDRRIVPTSAALATAQHDIVTRHESSRSATPPRAAQLVPPSLFALHLGNQATQTPTTLVARHESRAGSVDYIASFTGSAATQQTRPPAGASARRFAPALTNSSPIAGSAAVGTTFEPAATRSRQTGESPAPDGFSAEPGTRPARSFAHASNSVASASLFTPTPPADVPADVHETPLFDHAEPRGFVPPASLEAALPNSGEPACDVGSDASTSGLFSLRRFTHSTPEHPAASPGAPPPASPATPAPDAPSAVPEHPAKRHRGPVARNAVSDYFARTSACRAAKALASKTRIKRILNMGTRYESLTDAEIRGELTGMRFVFRLNRESAEHIDTALALSREVMRRLTGVRPLPEHIAAALALDAGCFVELEHGISIAAAIAAALTATRGRGCHVLSANEESAQAEAGALRPFYRHFGLRVAHINSITPVSLRRAAYACDVTYCTMLDALSDCVHDQLEAARPRPPTDKLRRTPPPPPPRIRGYAAAILCDAQASLEPEAPVWPAPLDSAHISPRTDNPPSKASVPRFLLRYRKLAGVAPPGSGLLKPIWSAYNLPLITSKS